MDIGSCIGYDGTVGKSGADSRYQFSLFVLKGGRAADKAFSSLREIGAKDKIQLSAGAADIFRPGTLRIDLSIQIDIYGVVNGDKVVQCADGADVIGIIHRCAHALRIVVQKIVEFFRTGCKGIGLTEPVNIFSGSGDLSGSGNIYKSIYIHFRMNTKIFQI